MNWTKVGALAAVVAVALGILAYATTRDGGSRQRVDHGGVAINGGSKNEIYYTNVVVKAVALTSDEQAHAFSREHQDEPPRGTEPWPFQVVDTAELGLKVRTTDLKDGVQIGALTNLATAWAICREDSAFDPVPGDANGARWLKIHWAHQTPDEKHYFESQPGATGIGWIYAGFTVPVGHSGDIPPCS